MCVQKVETSHMKYYLRANTWLHLQPIIFLRGVQKLHLSLLIGSTKLNRLENNNEYLLLVVTSHLTPCNFKGTMPPFEAWIAS